MWNNRGICWDNVPNKVEGSFAILLKARFYSTENDVSALVESNVPYEIKLICEKEIAEHEAVVRRCMNGYGYAFLGTYPIIDPCTLKPFYNIWVHVMPK